MDEIISYKMCAVKVRNAKLRNYLKTVFTTFMIIVVGRRWPSSSLHFSHRSNDITREL